MGYVMMTDPVTDRVAMFLEQGTSGSADNPNSARNAPLNSPAAHLDAIRYHSDFDYYQVHSDTTVSRTHAAVPARETNLGAAITLLWRVDKSDITLVTHNLGYVPNYQILTPNNEVIGQSSIIQPTSDGYRVVSPFATSSIIGLLDVGTSGANALASITRSYRVIVYRRPVADDPALFDYDPIAGHLTMGHGKWRGDLPALRRSRSGDAGPFDVPRGRTTDIRNGGSRTVLAGGTTYSHRWYDGSFSGSSSIRATVE